MKNYHSFVQSVYQIAQEASFNGIAHLSTQDAKFTGNSITINNKPTANFGSCSYLGLEFDERVKRGAIQAIERFGTQFSSSRAYVSLGIYDQLEEYFKQIFQGSYALVTPTTTLGHIAALPVLVQDDDAVILDHQVHSSVQGAANMLKARGIHVDMIRHNNLEMLEKKINELRPHYKNIWYLADGIYSMFGDGAPVKEIHALLEKYDQLHFYVDDAHGMSCFGPNGSGYVMQQAPMHRKQVIAVSLAKAFATGGAVLVFPTYEQYQLVRSCGGPLITSGPMQPGNLGAALEVAKIHMSTEIEVLKSDLQDNIQFTNLMLSKYGLPVVHQTDSPVFFVGVSLPKIANSIIKKMVSDGFYLNLGIYPAVPLKNTGIRFTITRLHTFSQIEEMVARLAFNFEQTLMEEEFAVSSIYKAFKMPTPEEKIVEEKISEVLCSADLQVETASSIVEIDKSVWDSLFTGRGTFDWEGCKFLQESFTQNPEAVNNWKFDYLLVKDRDNKPVLATFFTTAKSKDDMLASESLSELVEDIRQKQGADFLTSTNVMMGSMLTEGEHLFLDKSNPLWKSALKAMFEFASTLQDQYHANAVMFRDFAQHDEELDKFMMEHGFIKSELPSSNAIASLPWQSSDEWVNSLSAKGRRHVRNTILKKENQFEVSLVKNPSIQQIEKWYELYNQVKGKSLVLNTYTLPFKLFKNIALAPNWEVIELRLKHTPEKVAAVIFNYLSGNTYSAMFIGVNYSLQAEYHCYRQALYQSILRAKAVGAERINLGLTADFEKRRIGASCTQSYAYVQLKDHYNMSVLSNLAKSKVPRLRAVQPA
jgi:7-keto-8-aminopelargonate synthetase-like enzyme